MSTSGTGSQLQVHSSEPRASRFICHLWACRVFEIGVDRFLGIKVVCLRQRKYQSLSREGWEAFRTFRKLIACSRVVLVKLTKLSMASSGGSEAMAARGASEPGEN